jgi:hypothetical protein
MFMLKTKAVHVRFSLDQRNTDSRAEIEPHFSAKAALEMASGFNNDERL